MTPRASIPPPTASIAAEPSRAKKPPGIAPGVDGVDGVGLSQGLSADAVLRELADRGIRLAIDGDGLVAEGRLERLTDTDVAVIRARKAAIMQALHAAALTEAALDIFGGRIVATAPPGLRCACSGQAWRPSRGNRGHVYCLVCRRREGA